MKKIMSLGLTLIFVGGVFVSDVAMASGESEVPKNLTAESVTKKDVEAILGQKLTQALEEGKLTKEQLKVVTSEIKNLAKQVRESNMDIEQAIAEMGKSKKAKTNYLVPVILGSILTTAAVSLIVWLIVRHYTCPKKMGKRMLAECGVTESNVPGLNFMFDNLHLFGEAFVRNFRVGSHGGIGNLGGVDFGQIFQNVRMSDIQNIMQDMDLGNIASGIPILSR